MQHAGAGAQHVGAAQDGPQPFLSQHGAAQLGAAQHGASQQDVSQHVSLLWHFLNSLPNRLPHLCLLQQGSGAQHGAGAQQFGAQDAEHAGAQHDGSTGAQHDGSGAQHVGSGQHELFFLQNKPASAVLANRTTTTDARDIHFILTSPQGNRGVNGVTKPGWFSGFIPDSYRYSQR